MNWISVEERFPDQYADVLCCHASSTLHKPIVVHAMLSWDGRNWTVEHGSFQYKGNVTHWMPLPAPPGALRAARPQELK